MCITAKFEFMNLNKTVKYLKIRRRDSNTDRQKINFAQLLKKICIGYLIFIPM